MRIAVFKFIALHYEGASINQSTLDIVLLEGLKKGKVTLAEVGRWK
jgi:hypothetical protein